MYTLIIFQEIPYKFKVAVMIEYIRSLSQRDIPVTCIVHKHTLFIFQEIPYKFKVAVMIEYIRSLSQREIPVQVSGCWVGVGGCWMLTKL